MSADSSATIDELLERFRLNLQVPNSARLYGFEADEVKLNRALHGILEGPSGPAVLTHLARRIAHEGNPGWARLRSQFGPYTCTFQPRIGRARGDELVEANDDSWRLLIELKVEAGDGDKQLQTYLSEHPRTLGLLLDLGGRRRDHRDGVTVATAADYLHALRAGEATTTAGAWQEVLRDHGRTVEYLYLRDTLIREHDAYHHLLEHGGVVGDWLRRERRWIDKSIAKEVRTRLQASPTGVTRRISVHHDANDSAVDLWLHTGAHLGAGVKLFAKWRIGKGLALHVGAWDADNPRNAVKATRERLRPAVMRALLANQTGPVVTSNRPGRSGMIARATIKTRSIREIVGACRELLPLLAKASGVDQPAVP